MVSNLKSETARINGAKSRGPTTPQGKEISSRNAIKHGLTSGNGNILLDREDPDEFDKVLNKLLDIHEPATPAETDLVEEMVAARWRTRRMWTIETGLLNAEILKQAANTDTPDPNIHLASAFHSLADDSRSLVLASRYEARLQRLYDRSYKILRELQQARKSEEPTPARNIRVMWVDPEEEPEMPVAPAPPDSPSVSESVPIITPSVSEGRYSPTVTEGPTHEPNPSSEAGLRNEPTAVATKEVIPEPQPENTEPPIEKPGILSNPPPAATKPPSLN